MPFRGLRPEASSVRGEETPATALVLPSRRSIRAHHKSKDGCVNCKRRKVKCDRTQPKCTNCSRFRLPCSLTAGTSAALLAEESSCSSAGPRGVPQSVCLLVPGRRGRGRPRKDWTTVLPAYDECSDIRPQPGVEPASPLPDLAILPLQVNQAELLHQFITHTGPSLAGTDEPDDPIALFWARNAPRIGLSVPSVLHLSLSLAGYHLAALSSEATGSRSRYIGLAEHYFSVGLINTNQGLSNINDISCGGLYVSTVLVCFCAFAAGPSGSRDLLVCDVGSPQPSRWLPLARGARLLHQLYGGEVLFTGLTGPLGQEYGRPDHRPTCVREGFARVEWVTPIARLRTLVTSHSTPSRDVYMRSFDILARIYEATFGDKDGYVKCEEKYKMVLIWLYMMEDDYVSCLQGLESLALVLLAYFAPLLKTMKRCWFLHGWAEHLLSAIQSLVTGDNVDLLQWPVDAVRAVQS